jgi:energy-coupling factor transporter ATP-binding protein EcfA2
MCPPSIYIENLYYSYPTFATQLSSAPILRGIDLALGAGECLALMGPTGAGKTTLCLALNGLVPQSTGGTFGGDVWVAGLNTKTHPVAELATQVGLIFQDSESQLFNMTVEEEVAFGPESLGLPVEEIEGRIRWALDVAGLAHLRTRSPAHLSGGEQRRLAIAAVLAMKPGILVLDEPTVGLDPPGRRAVLAVMAELRSQGITMVMATQDADAAADLADRVVVLEGGKIVLEGTPQQVFGRVEDLNVLGVDVPQMVELSHCLGIHPPCLTVNQAFLALSETGWSWSPDGVQARSSANSRSVPDPQGSSEPAQSVFVEPRGLDRPHTGIDDPVRTGQDLYDHADRASITSPSIRSSGQPVVTFEDVGYQYEGGVRALAGLNLTISSGEYVALVGANGSGKTTLAKHVNGLLHPQHGRVRVMGRDTRQALAGELARQVGYVFQNPDHQIFASTVREEIAFGPRNLGLDRSAIERRVGDALAAFHLTPLAELPPATLGYGQRRLVALAAVHAMQPQVLVLDEPTVGLDRHLTGRLLEWVSERRSAGAVVIFITHDMRLACLAPRCIVMDRGQVMSDGTTTQILAHPDRLAQVGIAPPPVAELSLRLGLPATPLRVDEFCRTFVPGVRKATGS